MLGLRQNPAAIGRVNSGLRAPWATYEVLDNACMRCTATLKVAVPIRRYRPAGHHMDVASALTCQTVVQVKSPMRTQPSARA